ncbi:SulP family inorganic anion transporter [Paenibacillus dendritiformis]|uniref:SulP family inorganic anion transporter n=1 Tax=Paenibacillus dendritiformis TaxID=130049 RepID=UPI003D11010C
MIGQSVFSVKLGGRGRLSTLVAGVFLMFLINVLGDVVVQIPMPVLAGIMIMVSIGTFDWSSFTYMRKAPKTDAKVMLTTVIIVAATHDLSKGVIAGVLLSAIFFAAKISKIKVTQRGDRAKQQFQVGGQLFFASANSFVGAFDTSCHGKEVVIDFSRAHVWDDSAVGAIDRVVLKYKENNNKVMIKGLDSSSQKLVERVAVYHDNNAKLAAH